MRARSVKARKATNTLVKALSGGAGLIGVLALTWILYEVIAKGVGAINWSFFTRLPAPPGMPGGFANAIAGTLMMTGLAAAMGVPIGLLAGVYLSEFGLDNRFARAVRFVSNVLMGTPSIIIGVFVYTVLVVPLGHFSGYAGALGLAIIMLPILARTTEDILTLVPNSLRESALALGAPRWKTTLSVVFRAAKGGLLTGVLLAIARVSGETAPLLFTALNSPYWSKSLNEPTGNLTVTIFNYAMSPYEDWQKMAWAASLLITMAVLALTISARVLLRQRERT